jgi:hypothetical protein
MVKILRLHYIAIFRLHLETDKIARINLENNLNEYITWIGMLFDWGESPIQHELIKRPNLVAPI